MHIVSFLLWLATLPVHVVAYARRVPPPADSRGLAPPLLREKPGRAPGPTTSGRRIRLAVNLVALVAAAIPAVLLLPTASPWARWPGQGMTGPGILAVAVSIGTAAAVAVKRR